MLMTVSAAAELPCCMEGHRERQPAAKSAMPCHPGTELGCDRPRTKCTLSYKGKKNLSASVPRPLSHPRAEPCRHTQPAAAHMYFTHRKV